MNEPRTEVPSGRDVRGPDFSRWLTLERVHSLVMFDADGEPVTAAVTTQTVYDALRRLPELPQVARVVLVSATHRVEIVFEDGGYATTVKLGPDGGVDSDLVCAKVYNVEFNGSLWPVSVRDGLAPVIRDWTSVSYPYPTRLLLELASGTEVGLTIIGLDGVNYVLVDFWPDAPRLH